MPAAGTKRYITDQECPDSCLGLMELITFRGKAGENLVDFIDFVPLFLTRNSGSAGCLIGRGIEKNL